MQPFQHINARTIEEALDASRKNARFLAGGIDCLGLLKNKILPAYPEVLVNIKTIPGLDYITAEDGGLRIGALTTLSAIARSPLVRERHSLLAEAAASVGSPQIRNMGTLGGNLCQEVRCLYYRCSPLTGRDYFCCRKGGKTCFAVAGDNRYHVILEGKRCFAASPSDTAVALAALDATIIVRGLAGERRIALRDFFVTMGTALEPQEMVTEVRVPPSPAGGRQTFLKFRLRKAIDFAIVSVAAVIAAEDGVCRQAAIALGAVAPTPIRAAGAERSIEGQPLTASRAEEAAAAAVAGAKPLAMNAYKVEIAKALVKRTICGQA